MSTLDSEDLDLTPTESLLLSTIAAYRRLGLHIYLCDSRMRRAARGLADKGLIGHEHSSSVSGHDKTYLTPEGQVFAMLPGTSLFPALSPTCPHWYMGPETNEHRVDCGQTNHHDGEHAPAPDHAADGLTWTTAQARGRASDFYGPDIRRHEEEHRARLQSAIDRYRPDARIEDYL